MVTTRFVQLLLVACSVVSLTGANSPQTGLEERSPLDLALGGLLGGLLGAPAAGPTTAADSTSSTTKPTTSSSQPSSTPSNTPTQSSSSTTETPSNTPSTIPTTTSTTATPVTTFFTVTSTNTDGSLNTFQSSAVSTPTNTPNRGDSGMSSETRNTIIGVAVGVGGAIALCALGILAYRIWGRRRNEVDNEDLMNYGTAYGSGMEKSEAGGSAGGRTPFQSTLESYHNPTPVNASSNF